MRRLLPATLILACAAQPTPAQTGSLGLLASEEGNPLYRMGLTPAAEAADPVERGWLRVELWSGYSNIFEEDSTTTHFLYMDMERLINALTVRYGLLPSLEVGGRLTMETTWGGFLDGFLSGFHSTFGMGNGDREDYPTGAYGQLLQDGEGGTLVDVPRRTLALEEVRLFAKWRFWEDPLGRGIASLRVVGRLPTGRNRVGEERSDVAALLVTRATSGSWHFHAHLGAVSNRSGRGLQAVVNRRSLLFGTALERSLGTRWAAVVQFYGQTARVDAFEGRDIEGPPLNLVFGLVRELGSHWRVDASFQEDVPPGGPSVDFTFGIRVSRRW